MTTRHVTDVLRDIHGAPIPGASVIIGLDKSSYTGAAAYLRTPVTFLTDENGAFDVIFWCDEEGAVATRYYAIYPDGVATVGKPSFFFDLPVGDGSPVLMSSLRTAAPTTPVVNLSTLIESHAALKASTTVLGHVKVDGTTITATDGVISSAGGGAVASVNTQTGVVVLGASDVGADPAGTAAGLAATEASTRAADDTTLTNAISAHAARVDNPHVVTAAQVGAYTTAAADLLLAAKAPLASPALTGTPTAPTAAPGTNTTQVATTAFAAAAIAALVASSPATLDTLNELALALGSDPNFATTITNALALKAPLASPALTGTPTAPTAAALTSTTQLATTAFTTGAITTHEADTTSVHGIADTSVLAVKNADNQFSIGQGVRAALSGSAAAVYIPWITGDTLSTLVVGAATAGNNQVAVSATSNSNTAISGTSSSGIGVRGLTASASAGAFDGTVTDSATNTPSNGIVLRHRTSGTPAASFGVSLLGLLNSTTTADQNAGQITVAWTDATHASRTSALRFFTVNNAAALTERASITGPGAFWIGKTSGGLTGAGDLDVNGNAAIGGTLSITGVPTAPTAAAGTSTTQLATTAFVAAIAAGVSGNAGPNLHGGFTWSLDPAQAGNNNAPTAGVVFYQKHYTSVAITVASITAHIVTGGSGLTNCYFGLYDSTGSRTGLTADLSASLTGTGVPVTGTLTGTVAIAAGATFYTAMLMNGTTPAFARGGGGAAANAGLVAANGLRFWTSGSSLTALPTSVTVSGGAASSQSFFTLTK